MHPKSINLEVLLESSAEGFNIASEKIFQNHENGCTKFPLILALSRLEGRGGGGKSVRDDFETE